MNTVSNNIFTTVVRLVKVTAIASVLSLCTLQGVHAETPVPTGRPPIPNASMLVFQNSTEALFSDGTILYANGVYVFTDGFELLPNGTWLYEGQVVPPTH